MKAQHDITQIAQLLRRDKFSSDHPLATELRHFENYIVQPGAVIQKQGWALGRQAGSNRYQQHRYAQKQSSQTSNKNIKSSFHTCIARLNPSSTDTSATLQELPKKLKLKSIWYF